MDVRRDADNIDIRTETGNLTRRTACACTNDDGASLQIFCKGSGGMRQRFRSRANFKIVNRLDIFDMLFKQNPRDRLYPEETILSELRILKKNGKNYCRYINL